MKPLIIFTAGLIIGTTAGGIAGNWRGIAVTLQAEQTPQPSVELASNEAMTALPRIDHLIPRRTR